MYRSMSNHVVYPDGVILATCQSEEDAAIVAERMNGDLPDLRDAQIDDLTREIYCRMIAGSLLPHKEALQRAQDAAEYYYTIGQPSGGGMTA